MHFTLWRYRKYLWFVLGAILLAACTTSPAGERTDLPAGKAEVTMTPAQVLSPDPGEVSVSLQEPAPTQLPVQLPVQPTETMPAAVLSLNCSSPADLTPAMTEGPFYTPGSPERASLLEAGMAGTPLLITGYVLTPDCEPVPGAWLDFWQTDAQGAYDNAGFRLRGHQFTSPEGFYSLETVLPGEYPGRTAHIHVKVQAAGGPVLTTQLFFPGSAGNTSDSIFSEELLVEMQVGESPLQGTFNFILESP